MTLHFTPKTEKEIVEANLWPAGTYDFEIMASEPFTSSKGNAMIKLTVRLYHDDGRQKLITDYISSLMDYKLYHAAKSFEIMDKYEAGEISADDCLGKIGKCKVKVDKDKTWRYPDKNAIADYISSGTELEKNPRATKGSDILDDDIPF